MMRIVRAIVALVLMFPILANAQVPTPKIPPAKPPAAPLPQARIPVQEGVIAKAIVTARLEQPQPRSRTIRIGSLAWSCRGETCTTTSNLSGASMLNACQALRREVGSIAAFGDGGGVLSPADLRRCNELPGLARLPTRPSPPPKPAGKPDEPRNKVPIDGSASLPDTTIRAIEPRNRAPGMEPRNFEVGPLAELAITDVVRAAGDPLQLDEAVSVGVVVRNSGGRPATVRAGAAVGTPSAPLRYGGPRTIGPGGTMRLPLELVAARRHIRGDHFETTVYLFEPAPPGGDRGWGRAYHDANNADNEYRVRFPVDLPRRFDVVANLVELRILDDCDNVSEGDWIVSFGLAEFRDGAVAQSDATFWPSRNDASNVDSGSRETVDRTLRLASVEEGSSLRVEVSAVDCDSDSPFLWAVAPGPWPPARGVACNGEEVFEASGENDDLGVFFFDLGPADWEGDLPMTLVPNAYTDHECSDSPSHAYVPSVRLQISPGP